MNNVRLRRLQSDYEAIRRLVRVHPHIETEGVSGNPPEVYRLFLSVRSLQQRGDELFFIDKHRLEITLPRGYPRDAPTCRMLSPVFHPNIAPHAVCIGDHWSAAESLSAVIMRVCEMLAFQSYNIKSPLNGAAAQWTVEHLGQLPTDKHEFFLDLDHAPEPEAVKDAICSNCRNRSESLLRCAAGHSLCEYCLVDCGTCHEPRVCLVCGSCSQCAPQQAPGLEPEVVKTTGCTNCGTASESLARCVAGHSLCEYCLVNCDTCHQAKACLVCGLCTQCAPQVEISV